MWRHAALLWVCATACGSGEHVVNDDIDAHPDVPQPTTIALRFERVGLELDAIAGWLDQNDAPIAGPAITIFSARGTLAPPEVVGLDTIAHLVPDGTGVYPIAATSGLATTTRSAVVLAGIDDAWGQPEPVRGLVNTAGWEDGASISPDGVTLVVQYLPVAIDCIIGGSAASPACAVIGPIAEPERPELPGAARVTGGAFHNGCPTAGLDPLPDNVVVPPNAQWAFTRQRDGAFGKPRPVFYDGIDGCISSFGLIIGADGMASWSLDNPVPPDDGAKIHTAALSLEPATKLGTFTSPSGVLTLSDEPGELLALGEQEAEGNPFVMVNANGKRTVLFDDEGGRQDLMFSNEIGSNTWSPVAVIPAPVSDPAEQESQPFFDGTTLLFRRGVTLLASDWNGGAMDVAGSWSATRTILAPDTSGAPPVGAVVAVGEPSVATVNGVKELYFVYAVREADHLNLDVAVVRAR